MLTQSFTDAVAEAERIITGAPHILTEAGLAEGHDHLAGSIRASLQLAWAYQRDFPHFVASTGPYTKRPSSASDCSPPMLPRWLGRCASHTAPGPHSLGRAVSG